MRVGVVGINHKLADLSLREILAKACQKRFSPDSSTHGTQSFTLLSTCNRTEIYFSSEDLAETHSYILSILRKCTVQNFDQKLYSYFGYDCFLHLARVTAGLDSAIVAETEIQGQVKMAYEKAVLYSQLPPEMHYLFQKCLKIGKQVRTKLPLKAGLPDLEDAILHAGKHFFNDVKKIKILAVGASLINLKVVKFLKGKGCQNITLINRTPLKEDVEVPTLPWERLLSWSEFDWIIFGTKSEEFLLKESDVERRLSHKLIIDLSVPRNVDPLLGKHLPLLNLDQINQLLKARRQQMNETLSNAESEVLESTKQHCFLFRQKEQEALYPLRLRLANL